MIKIHQHIRGAIAVLLWVPLLAGATLGQHTDTVSNSQAQMKAKAPSATKSVSGTYMVHARQLPSSTSIREYVDAKGMVFAVAWDGPTKPDLNELFGQYFIDYERGSAANRHGRSRMAVNKPEIVIQSEGRMRAFHGKAYLPQSIPAGVAIEELE